MFAQLLSWLFPVRLPKRIFKDDLHVTESYVQRAHPWLGRNENIVVEQSAAYNVARMKAIVYAPSLRQKDIDREVAIREAYTSNVVA